MITDTYSKVYLFANRKNHFMFKRDKNKQNNATAK